MTDTQTPTLETLLRRWAELEPERCRLEHGGRLATLMDDGMHISNFLTENLNWYRHRIQDHVQEAIEARGMWWSFENEQFFVSYAATVHKRGGSKKTWQAFSEYTPAAALLSAYLQALEAQQ